MLKRRSDYVVELQLARSKGIWKENQSEVKQDGVNYKRVTQGR